MWLFFQPADERARPFIGLWVTNGTSAGTHELTGIKGAYSSGLNPSDLTVFKNEVLFDGLDASGESSLWVTNGTAAGTHELTGIKGADPSGLNPSDFTVFNNEVLFDGFDSSGERGLWVTNGTVAGTRGRIAPAVAIENARLFQNVETSLDNLRTTQDRLSDDFAHRPWHMGDWRLDVGRH